MTAGHGLSPASTVAGVVAHLETLRSPENVAGMARYGICIDAAIGVSTPDMRWIARLVGR